MVLSGVINVRSGTDCPSVREASDTIQTVHTILDASNNVVNALNHYRLVDRVGEPRLDDWAGGKSCINTNTPTRGDTGRQVNRDGHQLAGVVRITRHDRSSTDSSSALQLQSSE